MDINNKSILFGICMWIKSQPEYLESSMDDNRSLLFYAHLIKQYIQEENIETIEMIKRLKE